MLTSCCHVDLTIAGTGTAPPLNDAGLAVSVTVMLLSV